MHVNRWLLRCTIALCAVATVTAPGWAQQPLGPLDEGVVGYFVAPADAGSGYRAGDEELAVWALGAWERATGGALRFVPVAEAQALIRIHFVPAGAGQYGEMRALRLGERRGAAVYVRPDTDALGPDIAERARNDVLFRDTVVFLTCLHELGHALGLNHTADFRDIMFFFGYGGDIPAFFGRFRERLTARADIAMESGLSDDDVAQLRALYPSR